MANLKLDSYSHREWAISHKMFGVKRLGLSGRDGIIPEMDNLYSVKVDRTPDGSFVISRGVAGGYRHFAGGYYGSEHQATISYQSVISYDEWLLRLGNEWEVMPDIYKGYSSVFSDISEFEYHMNKVKAHLISSARDAKGRFKRVHAFEFNSLSELKAVIATCCYARELLRTHGRQFVRLAIYEDYCTNICDFTDDFESEVIPRISELSEKGKPFGIIIIWSFFADQLTRSEGNMAPSVLYVQYVRPKNDIKLSRELRIRYTEYVKELRR